MADEKHTHYLCGSCESVFCTDDQRYVNMVEGDSCPKCRIANVTRLPDQLPETLGGLDPRQMLDRISGSVDFGNLLIAASRIYPYMAQDFTEAVPPLASGAVMTPSEGRRATAAVEVAFLMADLILARMRQLMESPE